MSQFDAASPEASLQAGELYACGAYERIYIKVNPKVTVCYYRLKD